MNGHRVRLMDIVGEAGVTEEPTLGDSFSLDRDLLPALHPRFRVRPKDVDEVEEIVRWANDASTPLVPLSSGEPHLRSASAPSAPGSVLVDLSGMKRIRKIDRRNRLALIEPGVTFGELQPELAEAGLRLITPLLPKQAKSVITSLLEREPIMSPRFQWNLLEPLRSLEIVWGHGEKFWSGSGFFHLENEESWKQGLVPLNGPGPGQLDFYKMVSAAQGSMGIVTMASVKCEVLPEFRKTMRSIIEQAGLQMLTDVPGCSGSELQDVILKPCEAPYWKLRYKGGSQEIFFLTHLERTPAFNSEMDELAIQFRYPPSDIGVYIQPLHQGVYCHCEFMLPFDRGIPEERARSESLFREASLRMFKQGAYFSRPYGIWAGMVYNGDARTTIVTQKVKQIFDPNNVMNPGKLCF
ncbi:MAG: FAD-binding oxidoreductase [Anaerolineales bacterium]